MEQRSSLSAPGGVCQLRQSIAQEGIGTVPLADTHQKTATSVAGFRACFKRHGPRSQVGGRAEIVLADITGKPAARATGPTRSKARAQSVSTFPVALRRSAKLGVLPKSRQNLSNRSAMG
ncbi:hypothetical protein CEB3_c37200 [Peptococcaceae bacterium CEB3]|nr:hypothetical protein CEB3_c37200 [Peptococcaceae bacterium CEB3]